MLWLQCPTGLRRINGTSATRAGGVRGVRVRLAVSRLTPARSRGVRVRGTASARSRVVGGSGRINGMTASRIGPARSWGVGVHAARDGSGGTRGVRMNATHRGAVTTVATVSATSDIGNNSSSSNTEEYKYNERRSNTHDDEESVDK